MNLGPAGDWDLTEELTWGDEKIRFDEFATGDQNVISCEQGQGAIMIRNNGANLQFYVNDGSWKGGTCCDRAEQVVPHRSHVQGQRQDALLSGRTAGKELRVRQGHRGADLQPAAGHRPPYSNRYMRGNIQHVSIWADVRTEAEAAADVACDFSGTEEGAESLLAADAQRRLGDHRHDRQACGKNDRRKMD